MFKSIWVRGREALFPGRLRVVGLALALVIVVSLVTRLGLAAFNGDTSLLVPWRLAPALAIGLVYDLATALWFVLPLALLVWLWPARRAPRALAAVVLLFAVVLCGALVFTAASEFVFWNEFSARFNFIVVDYLIYTREVI
ncbi:MAG: hypothetical protein RL669_835, partial [Pseudomonadota bacterium]